MKLRFTRIFATNWASITNLVHEAVFSLRRNWAERSSIHLPLGSSSARSFKLCGVNVQKAQRSLDTAEKLYT